MPSATGQRDDPVDWSGFADQPVLRVEVEAAEARDGLAFAWEDWGAQTPVYSRENWPDKLRALPIGSISHAGLCGGCRAGHQADPRSVWVFLRAEGLSYKKKRSGQSTIGRVLLTASVGDGSDINTALTPNASSSSTRPAIEPTWRRCGWDHPGPTPMFLRGAGRCATFMAALRRCDDAPWVVMDPSTTSSLPPRGEDRSCRRWPRAIS